MHKFKFTLASIFFIIASTPITLTTAASTPQTACPDIEIIFTRGSGGERWDNEDYKTFKSALEEKLNYLDTTYNFHDLDYPAVSVGLDNFWVTLGALVGAGESYTFGKSIKIGAENLADRIKNGCPNTKYVLAGYSQGAMVVHLASEQAPSEKILYLATFGDPKIYLPEGAGLIPAACSRKNLSPYRMYVPDCRAFEGLLGSYQPYQPENLEGRVGTWCNKKDIFCSSYLSIDNHTNYTTDKIYEMAATNIVDSIIENTHKDLTISSTHDMVLLIDETNQVNSGPLGKKLIDSQKYKELATEVLKSGGRVAVYSYHTDAKNRQLIKWLDFTTSKSKVFSAIDKIPITPAFNSSDNYTETIIPPAYDIMTSVNWQAEARKSIVAYSERKFRTPNNDYVTPEEMLSRRTAMQVEFYFDHNIGEASEVYSCTTTLNQPFTNSFYWETFLAMPEFGENGKSGPLRDITAEEIIENNWGNIIEGYLSKPNNSLLKVAKAAPLKAKTATMPTSNIEKLTSDIYTEQAKVDPNMDSSAIPETPPIIEITNIENLDETSIKITFTSSGEDILVIINDTILGQIKKSKEPASELTITNLDLSQQNAIILTPIQNSMLRSSASAKIEISEKPNEKTEEKEEKAEKPDIKTKTFVPLAPNTGKGN